MQSKIVISSDFDNIKARLEDELKHSVKFFITDEFLLENAQAVVKEAYIAEANEKLLVIMAKGYRIEAQNALLKIIEEPPRNIFFMLVTPSKNMLLPTIRSRLVIENRVQKKERASSGLNLKQLDLKEIYKFIDEIEERERTDEFGKNELKELLSSIMLEALELGYSFSEDELSYFYKMISLADLNSRAYLLLTPLLLLMLKKGRR